MRVPRFVVLPALLAACVGAPTPSTDLLAAPPAGQGIQLQMVSRIEAGQDIEKCRFFQVGAEGLHVIRDEVKYTGGSHHVLVYRTTYTSVPTVTLNGATVDTSGVFPCAEGATADWIVDGVAAGAQASAAAPMIDDLPAGVAVKFAPGTVLLMNTHYLNATTKALDVDTRVNLWTIPGSQVTQEAGILFFYDPYISVPSLGDATARMSCPITRDITLVNGQSHMHRRGVGYLANLVDGNGATVEELYQGHDWENVQVKRYGGKALAKGLSIDYRCDYHNTEERAITQGGSTRDEMCMFVGLYYPRDRALEQCSVPDGPQSSNATFIGSGTASCGESVNCTLAATDRASYFSCIVDSCAANSAPISALLRCQYLAQAGPDPVCREACSGTDGSACTGCVAAHCQAELNTCFAASCG